MFKRRKVVMLPTNKKSKLCIKITDGFQGLDYHQYNKRKLNTWFKPQYLYITSNDEIKEGDWWLNKDDNSLNNDSSIAHLANNAPSCKKIIATNDDSLKLHTVEEYPLGASMDVYKNLPEPSQSFMEAFVREFNKGDIITDILVEYESKVKTNGIQELIENEYYSKFPEELPNCVFEEYLKVNPKDNTINIKKVKDSWNREEVENLCRKAVRDNCNLPISQQPYSFSDVKEQEDKWIEENLT